MYILSDSCCNRFEMFLCKNVFSLLKMGLFLVRLRTFQHPFIYEDNRSYMVIFFEYWIIISNQQFFWGGPFLSFFFFSMYMSYLKHVLIPILNKFQILLNLFIFAGTFSSVFQAKLRNHPKVDQLFALKHIIPTSHPSRIETELKCLQQLG